jgi:hypothetical protein
LRNIMSDESHLMSAEKLNGAQTSSSEITNESQLNRSRTFKHF